MWVAADTHFGHKGVCEFMHHNGVDKLRPWHHPDEMDEALIKNWNSVVEKKDRVYLLGDVVINRRCLPTLGRLNGRICLVKGNHDIFKLKDYTPYFDNIEAYVVKHIQERKTVLSHIPIHSDSLKRWHVNIHGHLHSQTIDDPRYVCVSMEQINFTPILLEEAFNRARTLDV